MLQRNIHLHFTATYFLSVLARVNCLFLCRRFKEVCLSPYYLLGIQIMFGKINFQSIKEVFLVDQYWKTFLILHT